MPVGRPSTYTPEIAEEICRRLAEGESLLSITEDPEMPGYSTICAWNARNLGGFQEKYARARDLYLDYEAERTIRIADTPQLGIKTKTTDKGVEVTEGDMIEHRNLQINTRKWYLARRAPNKFGHRMVHAGDAEAPLKMIVERMDRAK
jgi:hypothetical protein